MNAVAGHISRKFIGAVEDEWQLYSNNSSDYTVGPSIGFGASSIVYAAKFQPPDATTPIPCALKVLDLDRLPPSALRLLQNETQLMSLSKHPNVLRVRGTWVDGHKLYIAMRLMNAGSVADVMRYQWPGGLEEEVIRCILKQALEGLNYFHINGLIHRDVKAANLLIDDDGTVLLGDLGVAAFLWDSGGPHTPRADKSRTTNFDPLTRGAQNSHNHAHSRATSGPAGALQRPTILGKRKSFVGTPCWMAPEVINGKTYDASADIWSFGITAIELAQGRAPRSRMDPHKVLVMTVTDAPPRLERSSGPHSYSGAFAEMVATCLNKDPAKRPTAADLLQTHFFKNARKPGYLCNTIVRSLPPLTQRQERCKQASIHTHLTMDSWDFSASVPSSPTTSVFSHPRRPMGVVPQESVFEMEGEVSGGHGVDADAGGGTASGEDGDHADLDGHSSAEAYAVRIRARERSSLSVSRSLRSHNRSGSHHSLHSHHCSHSRQQSHDERPTVHSIQEVVVRDASDGEGEPSDVDRDQDQDRQQGAKSIPVALALLETAELATLEVPAVPSPAPSTRSSASATLSGSAPLTPSTPPTSGSFGAKSQRGRLWRRLAGKLDAEPDNGGAKEKDQHSASPPRSPSTSRSARKSSFGRVFGRTASMSVDLVRTMAASKQAR